MLTLFEIDKKIIWLIGAIVTPVICALLLTLLQNKLPRDQGREFAVDGQKSAGKVRGAGLLFIIAFVICALVFVKPSVEYILYYVLILAGMMTGYLDDASDKPWNEYKKGLLDLIISAGTSAVFVIANRKSGLLGLSFFGNSLNIHPVIYFFLGLILVWMLINAVNCTDGIDGFCGVLTSVSLISVAIAIIINGSDENMLPLTAVMILV